MFQKCVRSFVRSGRLISPGEPPRIIDFRSLAILRRKQASTPLAIFRHLCLSRSFTAHLASPASTKSWSSRERAHLLEFSVHGDVETSLASTVRSTSLSPPSFAGSTLRSRSVIPTHLSGFILHTVSFTGHCDHRHSGIFCIPTKASTLEELLLHARGSAPLEAS